MPQSKPTIAERRTYRQEALERLRGWLKPGQTVHTITRHVSTSGMTRDIAAFTIVDGDMKDLTYSIAQALGERVVNDGVRLSGCGMDMHFALVYDLGYALWPNGFDCAVEECRANDHSNERFTPAPEGTCQDHVQRKSGVCTDKACKPWHHKDAGYSLRKASL